MDYKKELQDLIETVVREGASDLHLTVGVEPTIRVSGFLIPLAKKKKLVAEDTLSYISEMLEKDELKLFLEQKEIDFVEEREGKLFGYEFKYSPGGIKAPAAFLESYPNSEFMSITPENYLDFIT